MNLSWYYSHYAQYCLPTGIRSPQIPLVSNKLYGDSVTLRSIVTFFLRLSHISDPASYAIIDGGGLDFMLNLYFVDFLDPLALNTSLRRLNLQTACESLLHSLSKTEQGSKHISKYYCRTWRHISQPTISNLQFTDTISDLPVEHDRPSQSIEPGSVLLQPDLVLGMVEENGVYHFNLPEHLDNIVTDALEFWG